MPKPDKVGIPTPTDLRSAIEAIKLLTEAVRQMQISLTDLSDRVARL